MKLSYAALSLVALRGSFQVSHAAELPITTTDVFIQSGEVSENSANIMARCNKEQATTMTLMIDDLSATSSRSNPLTYVANVDASTDYTHTFVINNLTSNKMYTYTVMCGDLKSMQGSFKTAPRPDTAAAIKFVWAADLAGQGYGRNPDFAVTHVDGTAMKGGYIVFETMEKLNPDFALFQGKANQWHSHACVISEFTSNISLITALITALSSAPTLKGDMIYADNAIEPSKNVTNGKGGEYISTWTNNPSKNFVAVTLDEFRANWKYNFGDDKMQSFLSKTPIYNQWDDHEVSAIRTT